MRTFFRIGTIDLARNLILKIEFQSFADLQFIDTIDLAENQIFEVQKEAFKNIFMTKVNLSNNHLENVGEKVFQACENMTVLDLSNNKLISIHEESLDEHSYSVELR